MPNPMGPPSDAAILKDITLSCSLLVPRRWSSNFSQKTLQNDGLAAHCTARANRRFSRELGGRPLRHGYRMKMLMGKQSKCRKTNTREKNVSPRKLP